MNGPENGRSALRRILYCEGNVDGTIGGSFFSLLYLVENLDRSRFRPVVVFHRENALVPRFRASGVEVHVIVPAPALRLNPPRGWRWAGPLLKSFQKAGNLWRHFAVQGLRCARFLRRNRIDLVHLNNSILRNHSWMLGALLTGTPCVTHERGINATYSREARFFARRLEAIICISAAVRASLTERRVDHRRLVLIHNGLDAEQVKWTTPAAEIRVRHGVPLAAPLLGIVGNIKKWKGQHVVVRACARLRERLPDVHCLLVGDTAESDFAYRQQLEVLIREEGLDGRIVFTGFQKDPADYMNAMDVVVHASTLPEPFGRVLIEAMALGKPLVASRDGAVTEIIAEEISGLTFTAGDDVELAGQIYRLLTDKQLAQSMGENARRQVREEFDIRRNVQKTEALYEELFGRRSTPPAAKAGASTADRPVND